MAVPEAENRGPLIQALSWALCFVFLLVLGMRLFVKLNMGKGGAWSLIWAIIAACFALASNVALSIAIRAGLGRHVDTLIPTQVVAAIEGVWIGLYLAVLSLALSKVSVCAFLLELQGPTGARKRNFLWFLAISNTIINVMQMFILLFQCKPVQKLWDRNIPGTCPLIKPGNYTGYLQGSWQAVTDLILAIYPSVLIWNLHMSRRLKLLLGILMGLGVFSGVVASLKTYEIHNVEDTQDPTYALFYLVLWAITEEWVVLIISSIPLLWPLFQECYRVLASRVQQRRSTRLYDSEGISHSHDRVMPQSYELQDHSTRSWGIRQGLNETSRKDKARSGALSLPEDGIRVTMDVTVAEEAPEIVKESPTEEHEVAVSETV